MKVKRGLLRILHDLDLALVRVLLDPGMRISTKPHPLAPGIAVIAALLHLSVIIT